MDSSNNNNNNNNGTLAIADGTIATGNSNTTNNTESDDPITDCLGEPAVGVKILLFGGVRLAGKVRCASKNAWNLFGGDANWNKLIAGHVHPDMYKDQDLGLQTMDAESSKAFLKNSVANPLAAPLPPPKPISEYAFDVELDVNGVTLQTYVPVASCGPVGVNISLRGAFGEQLIKASKAVGRAADGGSRGSVIDRIRNTFGWHNSAPEDRNRVWIDGYVSVRVIDRGTKKQAFLVQTESMSMTVNNGAGVPWFESPGPGFCISHDFPDAIDAPNATPRAEIFRSKVAIQFAEDDQSASLIAAFINVHNQIVLNEAQILRLMERLDWK